MSIADETRRRAEALHTEGRFDEAVEAYERARAVGDDPEVDYNLGAALRRLHRSEEAAAAYWRVLAARPTWPDAYNNLGLALADLGRLEEAEVAFECALALDPGLVGARVNAGNAQRDRGVADVALATFERARALDPRSAAAHYGAFPLLLDAAGPAAALDALDRCLAVRPDHAYARHYRAAIRLGFASEGPAAEGGSAGPMPDFLRSSLDDLSNRRTPTTRFFGDRFRLLAFALEQAGGEGLVVELGVWRGRSLAFVAERAGHPVHGFDSLVGLPEAWGTVPAGTYSADGSPPALPANAILHAGWFDETLPPFLARHAGNLRLLHVDCDLYTSTRVALSALAPRVTSGTVIVLDDYFEYPGWEQGEARALAEIASEAGWGLEVLAFGISTRQAAFRVTSTRVTAPGNAPRTG